MKKAGRLLLVLLTCLFLCSCGVDQRFKPLLEQLEEDNYDGIKAELSALLPAFQTEQEQQLLDSEKLNKYNTIIDFMESEDYESALSEIEAKIPKLECTTIDITLDNWQDYFEIRPFSSTSVDSSGQISYGVTQYAIYLRNEYLDRLTSNGANVTFSIDGWFHFYQFIGDDGTHYRQASGGDFTKCLNFTTKVEDGRALTNTATNSSTGNGNVYAEIYLNCDIIESDTVIFHGDLSDDFSVRFVNGTLTLLDE